MKNIQIGLLQIIALVLSQVFCAPLLAVELAPYAKKYSAGVSAIFNENPGTFLAEKDLGDGEHGLAFLGTPDVRTFVALQGEEVLGFICCECEGTQKGTYGFVHAVGVRQLSQRLGIGTMLLDRANLFFGVYGCKGIELDVLQNNHAAISFYEDTDFYICKSAENEYRMRKDF